MTADQIRAALHENLVEPPAEPSLVENPVSLIDPASANGFHQTPGGIMVPGPAPEPENVVTNCHYPAPQLPQTMQGTAMLQRAGREWVSLN